MSTYAYKSISDLSSVEMIEDNDIILVSQNETNGQLISKQSTVSKIKEYLEPTIDSKLNSELYKYIKKNDDSEITGKKTFTKTVISEAQYPLIIQNQKFDITETPDENEYTYILFYDKFKNECNYGYQGTVFDKDGVLYSQLGIAKQPVDSDNPNDKLFSSIKLSIPERNTNDVNKGKVIFQGISDVLVPDPGSLNENKTTEKATTTKYVYDNFVNKNVKIKLNGDVTSNEVTMKNNGTVTLKTTLNKSLPSPKWEKEMKITLSGDCSGEVSFDGSEDKILNVNINKTTDNISIDQVEGLQEELDSKISSVVVTPHVTSGTKLATINVNGISSDIYGSTESGGESGVANIGIGSVIAFAGDGDIPSNTLLCDGREVLTADYPLLYSVIRDIYGTPSSTDKFVLPNLNEKFIEGITNELSIGLDIEAGLPNITGSIFSDYGWDGAVSGAFKTGTQATSGRMEATGTSTTTGINFDASESNPIYGNLNTVQPPAVMMRYVIVYTALNGDISVNGGSGGVIDGTILTEYHPLLLEKIPDDDTIYDVYTVQNDCGLYLGYSGNIEENNTLRFLINGKEILSLNSNGGDSTSVHLDEEGCGSVIPVKKGTIIQVACTSITRTSETTLDFVEYKLVSTNPQVAFPDWDESKAIILHDGTVTTGSISATIPDNGYILCDSHDAVTHNSDEQYNVYINKILVYWSFGVYSGNSDKQLAIIPVSKDDNIEIGYCMKVTFYPVKSAAQTDCVSYVIESGKFNSTDGTIHSTDSENDSWYRLYSDGWCEQGGRNFVEIPLSSYNLNKDYSKDIKLKKSYENEYLYTCNVCGIHNNMKSWPGGHTFNNEPCTFVICPIDGSSARVILDHVGTGEDTGFIESDKDEQIQFYWETKGYIA